MSKIGKDVLGKKGKGILQTKKEREEYEEYKRRKAEEQEEKQKKKQKKVIKEKMPEDKEPSAEEEAKQEAHIRDDMRRHKAEEAESEGKTVHVDEHYREPPTQYEKHPGIPGLTEEEIKERMEEVFPSKKKEKKLV